jgi:hypothetical protein
MTQSKKEFEELLNFRTIDPNVLDCPVYRVFSLNKLLITIETNSLFLIKPRCWDDPFEGFLLKQPLWSNKGNEFYEFEKFYRNRFFGQCWTLRREADFLWRTYAPNKDGVMAKSTIRKLYNNFKNFPGGSFYIGKVCYMTENRIKSKFSNIKLNPSSDYTNLILDSLLVKREQFKEEQEVRLLYFQKNYAADDSQPVKLGLPPTTQLFDELTIDPRIDKTMYIGFRNIFRKLGFQGEINRSTLYDLPKMKVTIL